MELILNQPLEANTDKKITPLLKGRDIIIIGLQPWYYEIGSNCKNIATHLAEHNRVLYVNIPLTRKTYFSGQKSAGVQKHCNIIKQKTESINKIHNTMWEFYPSSLLESVNWLPTTFIFKVVDYFNNRRFAKEISKAIKALDFNDIILFNDNDIYNGYYLKELLKPSLYIYYLRDFLQGYDYWKKHSTVLEPVLIKKADIIVANSTYYAEYASTINGQSYYIGQGCDINLFNDQKKFTTPVDMKDIGSPIIGYVGALDSVRLDEKIIEQIALANPLWNVVLVGPEDDFFTKSHLHEMPNVHFLGRKLLQQLPEYVASFDICINPQLQNQVTMGNYPLKIDEYLALGKPVVATRTGAMKLFEKYTYLADRPDEYPLLVQKAIAENSQEKEDIRIAFARSHTWQNSMQELYRAILKHIA